jgi:putative flippase GtrA
MAQKVAHAGLGITAASNCPDAMRNPGTVASHGCDQHQHSSPTPTQMSTPVRVRTPAVAVSSLRRLLTPESGLLGQGTRYALAGSVVAGVYLLTTTLLAVVIRLPFREALAIGFTLQLAVHFTLQRAFVWVHHEEFALPFRHQAWRYLTVAGAQLGVTLASTSLLPPVLSLSAEVVYLITVALLTSANFLLFRNVVFHPERAGAGLDI